MKHLIVHLGQLSLDQDNESFSSVNLKNLFTEDALNRTEKILKAIDGRDLFPFQATSLIKEKNEHDSIIIFKEGLGWDQVIRLAVYLRIQPDDNWISKTPIIICSDNLPNPIYDRDLANINDIQNFLNIPGVFYKSFFALFGKRENPEGKIDYEINSFIKTINKDFDAKSITIISENLLHDRHSITNQWGAVKLALNAGYKISEINYEFPPTLYFNYLLKKYSIKAVPEKDKKNFGTYLKKKKVLLIDDNSEKGWKSVLEKIFGDISIDFMSFMMGVARKDNEGKWEVNTDLNKYDLIFLDLYMPEFQGQKPDLKNGENLLKMIKESYPQIPVIVFTASNKSWTREAVLNHGADGMYVKESPEYAGDQTYSKENFIKFEKSVKETLEKYKVLRPYWEAIQLILKDQTFLSISEKNGSKFKDRIEERLEMFYGLLKRGFEETEYNKNKFHFSDYELAFMTLWSTLNEISEANYNKTQPDISIVDASGNTLTHHPCGRPISYLRNHYKWEIVGQSDDVFVFYDYSLRYDQNTGNPLMDPSNRFYRLNYEQKSSFLYENNQFLILPDPTKTKVNYEEKLFLQIAFLIERKSNLSNRSNKIRLQQTLVRLNEVRNHLYLTHGSEISTGFYQQTEKVKRNNHSIRPNIDIKDLFELISFLLTGKENVVDI
jgi:DNA-binding NarL/FixJ family response regulator